MRDESENSVIQAIADLVEIEDERIAEEEEQLVREQAERAEAEALERKERARAEAAKRAEQAHALQVAEAEARVRVEIEGKKQEANDRIAALKAELAAVQASREQLQKEIFSVVPDPALPRGRTGLAWPVSLSVTAISIAALALFLFAPADPLPPVERAGLPGRAISDPTPPGPVPPDPTLHSPDFPAEGTDGSIANQADPQGSAVPALEPEGKRNPGRAKGPGAKKGGAKRGNKGKGPRTQRPESGLPSMAECKDDPLCGL